MEYGRCEGEGSLRLQDTTLPNRVTFRSFDGHQGSYKLRQPISDLILGDYGGRGLIDNGLP